MATWGALAALAALQSLVVGLVLVPLARRWAAPLGLIDAPNLARKQHDRPIPRAGGVAIFPAFWGCLAANLALAVWVVPGLDFLPGSVRVLAANIGHRAGQIAGLFAGCLIIFVLGVLDDRLNLPPLVRLGVQLLATVPLIASGIVLKLFLPPWLAAPITALWLVGLTNSFNFLDNMNGATSGVSVIICAVMAVLAALSREWYMLLLFAALAGAVLAFWFFNFPRASIFLGDAGSTHLGFLLGALAVLVTYYQEGVPTRLPILIPLVVFGVPLFDTISVMWIRWRAGRPLMEGDTNHLSHRLVGLGMTRTEAVLFLYGATLATGLAALPLREVRWETGLFQVVVISLIFFLLHWLERVSVRRRAEHSPRS
jgi:UDP-GlcNAc:undecaprenyl-phosphate GlcNAc-1-phosphate transferase